MVLLNSSLGKLGKTFKKQKEILKLEMNHDEIYADKLRHKKNEWVDFVENGFLCIAFSYARYCKAMENITGFSKKDTSSSPGLGWKHFKSLTTEGDEPI